MNKTNSALNTSDIKLIYIKYYSIRTVIINRGEFLKSVWVGSKQVPWDATSITVFQLINF